MISKSLNRVKRATFAVLVPHPDPKAHGMPWPEGTGFFINPTGYFITANHVIKEIDISKIRLEQPRLAPDRPKGMVDKLTLEKRWLGFDLALLKTDFERHSNKDCFEGLSGFPFIKIDFDKQEDGTSVYAYGFPLGDSSYTRHPEDQRILVGRISLRPRTTSSIISSSLIETKMVETSSDPRYYVLDKALNYGNSGGPVVLQESGKAFAVALAFQPVQVRQTPDTAVTIPSLYSYAVSLSNIYNDLKEILPADTAG